MESTEMNREKETQSRLANEAGTLHYPEGLQNDRARDGCRPQRRRSLEIPSLARLTHRWGVILAGGDGNRLRSLTRFIYGDDRPKQFCSLLGDSSLLQQARQRAERSICPDQILYSLTRSHQNYYLRDLHNQPSKRVVQPCNRGTAPAILCTLLQISQEDPDAIVAVLPSDHYYSRETAFTAALEAGFSVAEARPASVVLLGAQPKAAEVEYGWLEIGEAVPAHASVFQVKGFHEKPPLPTAKHLLRNGALWNTFVMVGHVSGFLDIAAASVPGLLYELRMARVVPISDSETRVAQWLYDRIAAADFSRDVLSPTAQRLLTLSLGDVGWSDLGDPGRVISALLESGFELPSWAARWRAEIEAEQETEERVSMAVA